ncbi:2193_t:CDS:2 [Diversispora eburnea]|uniref:2193_t:CDS:1 n=1 Tax=Diversispora eburnea TaxID=1213867 RepID=A0A9N8W882_9GLOM|nr:2193_t:CDS:2 [Diversispora eburnea]
MSPAYFLLSSGSDVIDTKDTDNLRNGSIIGIIGMIFLIVILLCANSNTNISSTPSFPIINSPSPTIKRDKIRNTDTWERYLKMINNPIRLNSVVNSKKYYGS